jgi:hypothetical protein
MNIKEVIEKYAESPSKLTVRTFVAPGETPETSETFVLFEGEPDALRFLGEAILAFTNSDAGCNWDFHPKGAGSIYFSSNSTVGFYLHKLPCDLHADNKFE